MANDSNGTVKAVLTALGLTSAALYFGLHRLIWRIWIVLSGLWVGGHLLLVVSLGDKPLAEADTFFYWWVFLPPLLLLIVVKLLDWIISAVRDDDR